MSATKKKKLETAINNLFTTPRGKPAPVEIEDISKISANELEVEVKKEDVPGINDPDQSGVEMVNGQVEPAVSSKDTRQPPMIDVKPEPTLPEPPVAQPAKPSVEMNVSTPALESKPEPQQPGGQESVQMVIFTLDGQYYGIDITVVQSIIKMQAITRLPHVPYYTIGLTNLRGKVVPVFSLSRRFGLPDCLEDKANRIIIIRREQEEVGLIVDGVSEVETILSENIEPAPTMTLTVATQFITGIAKLDERLVIFLNVEKVISDS